MLGGMLCISLTWWLLAHEIPSVNIKRSILDFPNYFPPLHLSCLMPVWIKYRWNKNSKKSKQLPPKKQNLLNLWWDFESRLIFVSSVNSNHFIPPLNLLSWKSGMVCTRTAPMFWLSAWILQKHDSAPMNSTCMSEINSTSVSSSPFSSLWNAVQTSACSLMPISSFFLLLVFY